MNIFGRLKNDINVRKNCFIIILLLITCANSAGIYYLFRQNQELKAAYTRPVIPMLKPSDVYFPDTFYLAGERVPLERVDVAESFKRELISNTYLHSSTIQILKKVPRIFPVIEPILEEEGIPNDFKYLAVIESSLNPSAVSPAGAVGLWQLMPGTAREYKMEVGRDVDERYDIEKSTRTACAYLKKAHEKFGSWTMAAASYNGGMNGMARRIKEQKEDDYYDLLLNTETARYVYRILALKQIIENPTLYDFYVSVTYEPEPYETVAVKKSVKSWTDFAQQHGISYKTLKRFNPWLRRASLQNSKHKTYHVRIPKNKEAYK